MNKRATRRLVLCRFDRAGYTLLHTDDALHAGFI